MYARELDGKEIVLNVTGKLWNASMVMSDQATGSEWSHILGQCMEGPLQGKKLTAIPSVMTDWATWKSTHPFTDVMDWPIHRNTQYDNEYLAGKASHFVIGIVEGDQSKAYGTAELRERPLLNDEFVGRKLVLWFDAETHAAWAFNRTVGERELEFERRNETIIDRQTGSTWNLKKGIAVAGPMQGVELQPLVTIPSSRNAWSTFHSESEFWTSPVPSP